jgi:hypothetical protein
MNEEDRQKLIYSYIHTTDVKMYFSKGGVSDFNSCICMF